MKQRTFIAYLFTGLSLGIILSSCAQGVIVPAYVPSTPDLPPEWLEILGPAHWRIEWVDRDGQIRSFETGEAPAPALELPLDWTNPVLAHPFWPEKGIPPGLMRPAGGLFPFDAEGSRLNLTWRGGVDALLYREMAVAANAAERESGEPAGKRQPQFFDWPRFRELMDRGDISEEIRQDPWLADWRTIAQKTIRSGFDRRRITVPARQDLQAIIPQGGLWIGTSPFAPGQRWNTGAGISLPVSETGSTYISSTGMLRCSGNFWVWFPWQE